MYGFIEKSLSLNDEDLEKINTYTRSEFDRDMLYAFTVALCNNDIDRDYEKFSLEALEQLCTQFAGKTGISDHSMKSADQKARIFETWVEKAEGKRTADGEDFYSLKAKAYMVKTEYYYDTHNEKVLMIFEGMVDGEVNPELFEDIKEGFVEDYIPLPGQYDINEYRIMEEFIYELPEGKNQDVLARTIQGRGAFRRFKDKLYDLNLEKHWYQYRDEAYEKIARQWCERHKIDIVE